MRLIYASSGEPIAFADNDNVFSMDGDWVGVVVESSFVHDATGSCIGFLLSDGRIAADSTTALRPKVPRPEAVVATRLPTSIYYRPSLPPLPPPYREASLVSETLSSRSMSLAGVRLGIFAFVFLWGLTSLPLLVPPDSNEVTLQVFANDLTFPALLLLSTAALSALYAINVFLPGGRRSKVLIVGSTEYRESITSQLKLYGCDHLSTIELDFDSHDAKDVHRFLTNTLATTKVDFVLFDQFPKRTTIDSQWHTRLVAGEQEWDDRLVSATTLVERVCGKYYPADEHAWTEFNNGIALATSPITAFSTRAYDLLFTLVMLTLIAPVFLLIAVAIALESGFPILYRQERVGRNGFLFNVIKFRSLRNDAEKDGRIRWATADDTRVTRVGRIIRRLHIDELPQLISVLKGDMSLVGPRPERQFFVQKLSHAIPGYELRHTVRPGITGWAQVRYEGDMSIENSLAKLAYDLYYIRNGSIALYLQILLETALAAVIGRRSQ